MNIFSKSVLLLVGVLAGVFVVDSVKAVPTTTVTWKVSSLTAGEARNLSAVVSTNSPGTKTWSKKGSCTLTPTGKPTKLTMGSIGSCVLTLKIAQSKSYPAKSSTKTITLIAPTATTTAKPMSTTTVTPITTTTLRPTTTTTTVRPTTTTTTVISTTTTTAAPTRTVTQSGLAFTPANLSISVGQSVAFVVNAYHNVTWQNGDPGRGDTGAAYSRTFSNAGTYSFFCSLHSSMTGAITVS